MRISDWSSDVCSSDLDIMTTQTSNNARRFSPIFIATITPASVSTSTAKNGNKYAVMKGATIAREGQEAKVMTAMAFGKSHTEVAKLLRKGRSVDLDTGRASCRERVGQYG